MSYQATRWAELQELHRTPKAVLAVVAGRVKVQTLEAYPSQETIARDLSVSRRTVNSAMAYLEEQGYLEREARHHRSNGNRRTDLITLRMETDKTVVQTWRSYSEFLEETQPSRYAHRTEDEAGKVSEIRYEHSPEGPTSEMSNVNVRGGQCERRAGPMRTAFTPMNRKEEQEVEAEGPGSTSTRAREDSLHQVAIHITATHERWGWSVEIDGLGEREQSESLLEGLSDILRIGLENGVAATTLAVLLQDALEGDDESCLQDLRESTSWIGAQRDRKSS